MDTSDSQLVTADASRTPSDDSESPTYTVTQLNRRVAADDPKGFLASLVKHIKETRCGVDCSEATSIW